MAQSSAAPITNNMKTKAGDWPLVPPDERFWQRYSPHYELPISGVSSFAVHAVVLGLAATIATLGWFLIADNKPIPIEVVLPGGGNPKGIGDAPADGPLPEDIQRSEPPKPDEQPDEPKELPRVNKSDSTPLPNVPKDPAGKRDIENSGAAVSRLARLKEDADKKLMAIPAGRGLGGPGKGVGKGRGPGPGNGSGLGRSGGVDNRKRSLRWVLLLEHRDGEALLRQLDGLNAIIGVPEGDGTKARVVRDLKQELKHGDTTERIYWWESKEETVRMLARALGISPAPRDFVMFFPAAFERKLFDLERQEMQRRKGHWNENEIHETQFRIVRTGNSYAPVVDIQTYEK